MAAANPYLNNDDDDDDDIGGPSNSNQGVNKFGSGGANALPLELVKALKDYMGAYLPGVMPDALSNMPIAFQAMSGMYDFFTDFTRFKTEGPLLWAVAEVVDQMSNGMVRLIFQLHDCERTIINTHAIQRVMRRISENPSKAMMEHMNEISIYYEVFNDLVAFSQSKATNLYLDLCEKLGREPDQVLINEGFLSSRDSFARAAMARPPARSDEE